MSSVIAFFLYYRTIHPAIIKYDIDRVNNLISWVKYLEVGTSPQTNTISSGYIVTYPAAYVGIETFIFYREPSTFVLFLTLHLHLHSLIHRLPSILDATLLFIIVTTQSAAISILSAVLFSLVPVLAHSAQSHSVSLRLTCSCCYHERTSRSRVSGF